jgi:hypothetical protein
MGWQDVPQECQRLLREVYNLGVTTRWISTKEVPSDALNVIAIDVCIGEGWIVYEDDPEDEHKWIRLTDAGLALVARSFLSAIPLPSITEEPRTPTTIGEALDWLGTPAGLCRLVGIKGRHWASLSSLKPHLGRPVYSRPRTSGYFRVRQFLAAIRAVNTKESVEWLKHAVPENSILDAQAMKVLRPKDWKPEWFGRDKSGKSTADLPQT